MPHQQLVWDVALEVDADGRFVYDEIDLSTMRQTSKTTTMFVKQVWRLTRGARMWGPQRSTYTAQKRQMARNKLERDFAEVLLRSRAARQSFTEIKNPKARPGKPTDWKLSLNNGSEHMLFGRGNYLQIDAPTKTAGHGDTLDDGNIDEAFAHADDSVEQAMRPAQATRFNSQLWVGSTAGDERSFYWYGKVLAGRDQIRKQTPTRVAYFEWSIPDEVDIEDEDAWWEYMPALGHTISPEFVRSELERARRNPDEGGETLWRRAYGNQWINVPMIGDHGSIIDGWAALTDGSSEIASGWAWALSVSPIELGPQWSAIGIAGRRADGDFHVEWMEHRQGTAWVIPYCKVAFASKRIPLRVHKGGPESALISRLIEAGVEVTEVSTTEVAQATGLVIAAANGEPMENEAGEMVIVPGLRHLGQASLNMAVKNAVLRTGVDGAVVLSQRKSSIEITPFMACTVALGGVPSVERDSVYGEERGLTVVG